VERRSGLGMTTDHLTQHWTFRVFLLVAFCFLLGFSYNYHLPKLEAFLLIEIEKLTQRHSPVRVWAKRLHFHLFPLGVVLEEVTVIGKSPLDKIIAPLSIKRVGARLAILPLLRGEFRLGQLYLREAEVSLFLREELFKKKNAEPPRLDFDFLYSLPIDELSLEKVVLQARIDPQNFVVRAENLNLTIENRFRSIYVDLETPVLHVKPSGPTVPLTLQAELRTLIEAKEMQISALKLKADDGFFVASGRFNGDFGAGVIDNGAVDARAKLDFANFNQWERIFFKIPHLPALLGRAEIDVGLELRNGKPFKIESEIKTEDLKVDIFYFGQVSGRMSSDMKSVRSPEMVLRNDSGSVRLKNVQIELEPKDNPRFTAQAFADKVKVERFLHHLDIKGLPVELPVSGEATCQGEWLKKEITCKAKVATSRFYVHTGRPSNSAIVEAHDLRASGDVKIGMKQVEYQADIQGGKDSKCKSTGVIHYDKGFKINYDAEKVAFADVKNLANLKWEGNLVLKGSTEGTSDWATIDMHVSGTDLWLENYPLGQLTGNMKYKAGHITFPTAQGQYGVTRYAGDLDIDLLSSTMKYKIQVPFVEMKDLAAMYARHWKLPIEVSGTGTGFVEGGGPFDFRAQTYTVRSNFYRGQAAGETFDQLTFNIKTTKGMIHSENIHLTKANGVVEMKGQVNPQDEIDAVIVARSLRLEQSETVLGLGFDVQGLADVTMLMRGKIPRPHIELNGRFSRVVLADQTAEDSIFKLSFFPNRLEGSGQFLGSKLFGDFILPYEDDAPFLVRMKAKKWDFTTLFSLVSRTAKQLDFETLVTGTVNLQAPKGGLWASTGNVQIDEFTIRKGTSVMAAEKPMHLTFKDGVVNSNNFAVSSGDSYLKLDVANLGREQFNASLNGKMDLSLLGLFTPFISDLRGHMAISVDLRGKLAAPKLSGSAYLEKGYAKFVDFTHPFSNVRADVLFNDNQILVNSVRSDLAGGKVAGDGKLTFTGNSRPTVDVKGTFQEVKINVPENFRSQGSGTVAIRGTNFPYVMDIQYGVTGGEVTYEIGEDVTGGATTVKASAYLPKFLYQETFHPFTFLIDVGVRSPVLVNNSQMQANVSGNIKAVGTPDRMNLTGTLAPLPGAKVFFRDQPFDVQSAFVEYTGNPPWAPRIYVSAAARVAQTVQDDQGRASEQQYDITLLVQGRGPSPQIVLSSQPPLSQREIVSLLALGVTTAGMDGRRSSDYQATNTSTALGSAILQRAGGKKLKDAFGVDLKVSSSQSTQETASSPKVTLSKQWTPKFGASASSTISNTPTNNVKVEYKMNKNVSAVGSWEGKETVQDNKGSTQNVFGLDLEYKVQFK
jgi:translocation and assembly module TamB